MLFAIKLYCYIQHGKTNNYSNTLWKEFFWGWRGRGAAPEDTPETALVDMENIQNIMILVW